MKNKPAKKTAKTAPQDAPKKVFDVSRPGKTPVSPTSRPVIVGHKPQVKDPMMSDRDERPLLDGNKKVTVQPVADTQTAAVLPPSDSDSAKLPSASASLEQEGSRTGTVAGGTGGGAPAAPQPLGEHDGEASASDRTRVPEAELAGGSTGEEAPSAPEVPDAEKPAESSTADSVATIATSSVVDDVPPPQEDTAEPSKPVDPVIAGTKNSGLIFDDLDGSDTPDLTKPSPAAGGMGEGTTVREPARSSEASATQRAESELVGGSTEAPSATGDAEPAVSGQAVVSHHKQSSGTATVLMTLFILVLVAGIVVDILLDMGILNVSNIPHTNFFPPN